MHRLRGAAADLHGRPWPPPPEPAVWVLDVDRPALVLGSTQPDLAAAPPGVAVARRRSGGGAVLVEEGGLLWVDVAVPAGDRLWQADVGRAFLWLGEVWVAALAAAGVEEAVAHPGPLRRSRWSDVACFAGLGPGEVTLTHRKVVGISQRRSRDVALFQCAALLRWDGARMAALLGVPEAAGELAASAAPLPVGRHELERSFLEALARV
ncbi:MAG: lipoyl protein ligase domain-containing protein [Acidimicrobiia bacterium]